MTSSLLTTLILVFIFLVSCSQSPSDNSINSEPPSKKISDIALLSATCSGCHDSGSVVGDLRNHTSQQLYEQMVRYKNESGTTVMHRLMNGYTIDNIRLISEYLGQMESTENE